MLTLRRKKDRCAVDHFHEKYRQRVAYSFSQDSLPERVVLHLQSLDVFSDSEDTVYILNAKQNRAMLGVLKKLNAQRKSDYIFSEHLQKTYLIELIHLITKIHYSSLLVR